MTKALSRDPEARYQTAGEMAEDLRAFLHEMGVDDAEGTLARYLADPDGVASELRDQSLAKLLEIGESAAKSGDVAKSQSALSRALAIDDGNERALQLLGRLGRRRRRGALVAGAVALVVLAFVGVGAKSLLDERAAEGGPIAEPAPGAPPLAEPEPSDERPASSEPDPQTKPPVAPAVKAAPTNGRRWVVFKPSPPNVSIGVDGGALEPFGPDFQRVRVKVGNHTFRFVGAEDCCEEKVVRRRIPAGARDFELAVKLRFKPARLYLKGPTPSDATVRITLPGNRTVAGRIREILRIPMRAPRASAQVEIRAPGYRTHKSVVKLRAGGDMTEHAFKLERNPENP